jgi:hypothetical protein
MAIVSVGQWDRVPEYWTKVAETENGTTYVDTDDRGVERHNLDDGHHFFRHREDGPAVTGTANPPLWYLGGRMIHSGKEKPKNWHETVLLYQIQKVHNQ